MHSYLHLKEAKTTIQDFFFLNAFLEVTTSHFEAHKLREAAYSRVSLPEQGYSSLDNKVAGRVNHTNTAQPETREGMPESCSV